VEAIEYKRSKDSEWENTSGFDDYPDSNLLQSIIDRDGLVKLSDGVHFYAIKYEDGSEWDSDRGWRAAEDVKYQVMLTHYRKKYEHWKKIYITHGWRKQDFLYNSNWQTAFPKGTDFLFSDGSVFMNEGWMDRIIPEQFILDLESEKKRKEMIDRVNRIKYILFGSDSPLQKIFTDYNGYFKPKWDKTKTEEEQLCSRHLWE